MNTVDGIITFFQSLPAIITLISRLGRVLDHLNKYAQQNNLNGWINDLEAATDKLKEADTAQKKLDAAHSLITLIRSIGPQ